MDGDWKEQIGWDSKLSTGKLIYMSQGVTCHYHPRFCLHHTHLSLSSHALFFGLC